jgi:predicted enzyme related to lactoylglutathione lyase
MSNADIRGRFMWHELMTTDTDAAGAFYSKVMPWKTQPSGMPGYTLWYAGKTQAGGLMALPEPSSGPHWLTYIGTPSVDSALEGVQRLGGKVLKGATDIPNVGRYAVVCDPQGATFALYTPAAGAADGAGAGGAAPGGYTWHELATTDVDGAVKFYTELFGWEKGPGHEMGGDVGVYQLIVHGGQQIGGIFKSPNATPPNWLTYVHVADIDKAVNAVKGGGGRIMNGPHQVPGGSWILQATDPQGGMFAVIEPAEMGAAAEPAQPAKAAAPKPASAKPAAKPAAAPKPAAPAAAAAKEPAPAAKEAAPKAAAPKAAAAKPAAAPKPVAAAKPAAAAKSAAAKPAAAPRKAAAKAGKKATRKAAPKPAAKKRAAAKRGVAAKKASSARRGKAKAPAKRKAKAPAKAKTRAKAKGKRR